MTITVTSKHPIKCNGENHVFESDRTEAGIKWVTRYNWCILCGVDKPVDHKKDDEQ